MPQGQERIEQASVCSPIKEVELEVTHTPREVPGSGAGESEARPSPWGGPRTRVLNAIKFQRQFQGHGSQQRASSEIKCSNMIQKQPGEYNALFYVAWPDVQDCSPFYVCVYFKHEPRGQHGISVKQLRDSHGRIWKKGKQSKCL